MLTAAEILALNDRKPIPIQIPEWGGEFFIRPLSGKERDAFEGEQVKLLKSGESGAMRNLRGRMAVRVLCGPDGVRLFSDEQAEAVGDMSANALDRIFDASRKLNRIGGNAEVEDAKKNSSSDPSVSSGSALPPISASP